MFLHEPGIVNRRHLAVICSALLILGNGVGAAGDRRSDTNSQSSHELERAIAPIIQSLVTAVSARDINQLLSVYADTVELHGPWESDARSC